MPATKHEKENLAASVIVPLHADTPLVRQCITSVLASIVAAEENHGRVELILALQSADLLEPLTTMLAKEDVLFRTIINDRRGPARGRNLAAARSRGRILLFTDSDCQVEESWVSKMMNSVEPTGAVIGDFSLAYHNDNIFNLAEEHLERQRLKVVERTKGWALIDCRCFAILRELFLPFDENIEVAGAEDIELGLRLKDKSVTIAYNADVKVRHAYPTSLVQAVSRKMRHAKGIAYLCRKHGMTVPYGLQTFQEHFVKVFAGAKPKVGLVAAILNFSFFVAYQIESRSISGQSCF